MRKIILVSLLIAAAPAGAEWNSGVSKNGLGLVPAVSSKDSGQDSCPGLGVRTYTSDNSWSFADEARNALRESERGYRAAGYGILSSEVVSDSNLRSHFRITLIVPSRSLPQGCYAGVTLTYASEQNWPFADEAKDALREAGHAFAFAGYSVVGSDVFNDANYRYYYRIRYVRAQFYSTRNKHHHAN